MFKDYMIVKFWQYDNDKRHQKIEVKIIDDHFEIKSHAYLRALGSSYNIAVGEPIIKIYSEKKLPVAENLALFILKIHDNNNFWLINNIIICLNHYVPQFYKYKEEVEKILLFS